MKYYVYSLIDPFTNKIRYIGKSHDPHKRLIHHLQWSALKSKTHKNIWIKSLLKRNSQPVLKIIAKTNTYKNIDRLEKKYISLFKNKGYNLTNGTTGGDGWPKGFKMKLTEKRLKSYKARQKKVIARNLKTNEEKVFESVKNCAEHFDTYVSLVCNVLGKKKKAKTIRGWNIRYFGTEFVLPIFNRRVFKVKRTCLKTKKIKIYENILGVREDGFVPKHVREVCVGYKNRSQHLGYKWEYIENEQYKIKP